MPVEVHDRPEDACGAICWRIRFMAGECETDCRSAARSGSSARLNIACPRPTEDANGSSVGPAGHMPIVEPSIVSLAGGGAGVTGAL